MQQRKKQVNVTANRKDSANVEISATLSNADIEQRVDKIAKETGKKIKVDGFRKGKVPPAVVKKLYGDQLKQDAEAEVIGEVLKKAYEDAGIDASSVLGDPFFKKYDKGDETIEIELLVCTRPEINLDGYKDIIPAYDVPEVTDEEIEERLKTIAEQSAKPLPIKEDRELKEGDVAVFDFTGYLDGEEFEGGKAQNYELEIGSGQFIPGFEEQMVGMKKGETKRIKVTFPEDYQSEQLAGKEAEFEITLHDIKEKQIPEIDDELAKKVMHKDDATLEQLREDVKKQIRTEKVNKLYNEELKPKLLEALVEKFEVDLPETIVEQEIDNLANQKARTMSEEEIEEIKNSEEKLNELRESVREEAQRSVKATFIVDALAKEENITVDDSEITQVLYYEALMSGQDPEALLKYYKENNLFPAIKMGMIEDRLFAKLLELDKASNI